MFTLTMTGDRAVNAFLSAMPGRISVEVDAAVRKLGYRLLEEARENLSGRVLQWRTGALRDSLRLTTVGSDRQVSATVGTASPYARINEYGGQTPPHVIMPVNGRLLAFPWRGGQAFFAKVNHPGSKIPERSFLRSALASMRDEIKTELESAVARASEPR